MVGEKAEGSAVKVSAVIVAAGRGTRFGGLKQFAPLLGRPLIHHTLAPFQAHPGVDEIVLVLPQEALDRGDALQELFSKLARVVPGGAERSDSVRRGVEAARGEWVLVHDGARPCLRPALISRILEALARHPAAAPYLPVRDTLKRKANDHLEGWIPRDKAVAVQTPQGFHRELLLRAHRRASRAFTDDTTLVEEVLGVRALGVPGDPENLKVTVPEDLARAEGVLRRWLRIGLGWDAHRLVPGRPLILGGVEIPFDRGPVGHSDGDALIHAVIDALLGAAALGDIGTHFPDSDPAYAGISSLELLRRTQALLARRGILVLQVDAVVVLERPKLAPYRARMIDNLARVLSLPPHRISVKAKTAEGMGAVGRGKGIEAQAVALILAPEEVER